MRSVKLNVGGKRSQSGKQILFKKLRRIPDILMVKDRDRHQLDKELMDRRQEVKLTKIGPIEDKELMYNVRLLHVYATDNIPMYVPGTDVVRNVTYLMVCPMTSGVMLPMQIGGEIIVISDIQRETAAVPTHVFTLSSLVRVCSKICSASL